MFSTKNLITSFLVVLIFAGLTFTKDVPVNYLDDNNQIEPIIIKSISQQTILIEDLTITIDRSLSDGMLVNYLGNIINNNSDDGLINRGEIIQSISNLEEAFAIDYDAAQVAGAEYLKKLQADITEDNAGNGTNEDPDDPDDGGWDWALTEFSHSTSNSPTNIYGATALGVYYTYLETSDPALFTTLLDAADHIVSTGATVNRAGADMKFLLLFNDLYSSEVSATTVYADAAKAKYDQRISEQGSATVFAEYIRDARGVSQGYANGIIAWDIGIYAVVAQMLYGVYGGSYDADADAYAEVLWQDSFNDNPGLFDVVDDAGFDPTYEDKDFWWYTLGITGLIDAFNASGSHTAEISGLITRLLDSQYPNGAISGSYGAHLDDEDWQSTGYAMMSLGTYDQATYQSDINLMGEWIGNTQDISGGWVYSDGYHYPEIGGECTAGMYFTLSSPGDAVDFDAVQIAGANYLRYMQADITEDNAGNGSVEDPDDPDDGGWDWSLTGFSHTPSASPTNIYGATALGIYYTYLETGDTTLLIALQDAADYMVDAGPTSIRAGADMKFLLLFNQLMSDLSSPFIVTEYADAARAKYDQRISEQGSATIFAEYIRDARGVSQGYPNGIIAWDIGIYAVVAQMLYDKFGGTYDADADAFAEVLWQDSFNDNPGLFDVVDDAGFDPTYEDKDFWWYSLGITGLIDAFNYSGSHTDEIPDLVTRLLDCKYPNGAISGSYGANVGDEDWQSAGYAMMSLGNLDQATYQSDINDIGDWVVTTQDVSGGWVYSSGSHYPEIGGECLSGLYFTVNSCCEGITGDINNDGSENADISDLLYLVDYMFITEAPAPVCPAEADINGDLEPNPDISDLLYLVDYMFLEGAPSPAPCP